MKESPSVTTQTVQQKTLQERLSTVRNFIGEAIGEASMCWDATPSGVFLSTEASRIVDRIMDCFEENIEAAQAAPAETKDVPSFIVDGLRVGPNMVRHWLEHIAELEAQAVEDEAKLKRFAEENVKLREQVSRPDRSKDG